MTQGHKGSIIPHKGGVAPIDNNTTFYAPYLKDASDIVKGTRPLGERSCIYMDGTNEGPRIQFPSISGLAVEGWFYIYSDQTQHTMGSRYLLDFRLGQDNSWVYTSGFGTNWANGKLYINGVLQTTKSYASLPKDRWFHMYLENTTTFTDDLVLFSRYSNNENMKGKLETFRVWNSPLSKEEVESLYQGKEIFSTKLVGYWNASQGEGNILYDLVGGNDAIIIQGAWQEGRSVYSLMRDSKNMERAILIEKETENLNDATSATWSNSSITEVISTGTPYEYEVSTIGTLALGAALTWRTYTTTTGASYTLSAQMKGVGNTIGKRIRFQASTHNLIGPLTTLTSEYQTVQATFVAAVSSGTIGFGVEGGNAIGEKYIVKEIQLEKGAFATSFVDSVRSNGSLSYPKELINPAMFTLSAWVKLNVMPSKAGLVSSGLVPMFEISNGIQGTNRLLFGWLGSDELVTWISNLEPTQNQGLRTGRMFTNADVGVWRFYTTTFDGTTYKAYVDGKLVKSGTMPRATYHPSSDLYIGGSSHGILNGNIKNVRIDKVARTPEEVAAWYHQGKNGV